MHSRTLNLAMLAVLVISNGSLLAADMPLVEKVGAQPLWAQARRVIEDLDFLGNPLPEDKRAALEKAAGANDGPALVKAIQAAFDPHCLLYVNINPESRVKVAPGPAQPAASPWRPAPRRSPPPTGAW